MKDISIQSSPIEFTLLLPYDNKDISLVYSDKKSSRELSALYELGMYNNSYKPTILHRLFSINEYNNKVNLIKSRKTYFDLNNKNNKESRLIFLWSGRCTSHERDIMQDFFSESSDEIYELYTKYHQNNHDEHERVKLSNQIDNIISLLVFKANIIDVKNNNKEKREKRLLLSISIIYIILLGVITFGLLAKQL